MTGGEPYYEQYFERLTEKFGFMLQDSVKVSFVVPKWPFLCLMMSSGCLLQELRQEMKDSRNSVSASALFKLQHSIFAIMANEPQESGKRKDVTKGDEYCCAGFFFREQGLAATANHCLDDMKKVR